MTLPLAVVSYLDAHQKVCHVTTFLKSYYDGNRAKEPVIPKPRKRLISLEATPYTIAYPDVYAARFSAIRMPSPALASYTGACGFDKWSQIRLCLVGR